METLPTYIDESTIVMDNKSFTDYFGPLNHALEALQIASLLFKLMEPSYMVGIMGIYL